MNINEQHSGGGGDLTNKNYGDDDLKTPTNSSSEKLIKFSLGCSSSSSTNLLNRKTKSDLSHIDNNVTLNEANKNSHYDFLHHIHPHQLSSSKLGSSVDLDDFQRESNAAIIGNMNRSNLINSYSNSLPQLPQFVNPPIHHNNFISHHHSNTVNNLNFINDSSTNLFNMPMPMYNNHSQYLLVAQNPMMSNEPVFNHMNFNFNDDKSKF